VILAERHLAVDSLHHASTADSLFAIRWGPQASPAHGLEQSLAVMVWQAVNASAPANDHLLRSELRLETRRYFAVQLCRWVRGEVTRLSGGGLYETSPSKSTPLLISWPDNTIIRP
jgi:hypothetical protein